MFLLVAIPLVSAAPPFQVSESTAGLDVRFPPLMTAKLDQSVTAHTHVYNRTNGLPVNDDGTQCSAHLYNSTGNHILESEMEYEATQGEWELKILGGNFTDKAGMSFIIWCNSSGQGGFVSGALKITTTGTELTTSRAIIYIGLIAVLVFLLVITLGTISLLPAKNTKDDEGILNINRLKYLRPVFWVLAYMLVMAITYLTGGIAQSYFAENIGGFFLAFFKLMFIFMFPMVLVWLYWILHLIIKDNNITKLLLRGADDFEKAKFMPDKL